MSFSLAAEYNAKFIQTDSVCGHLEAAKDELRALRLEGLCRKYPVFVLGGVRFKYQPVKSGRTSSPIDSDRVRQFMNIVKQVRESQQ